MEVSEYERGVRKPGLDNLIRYLRGVGADLCILQTVLEMSAEPLAATTDEQASEDWRQLHAAFERASTDETLERTVRSDLEGLGWDGGSLGRDARAIASDKTEIPVLDLEPGQVSRSPEGLDPFVRIGNRLGLTEGQLKDELRAAERQVRKIVRLEPKSRCSKIRGARSRYRGPLFGALLLEEARRAIPGDPAESLSLADAALLSCNRTSPHHPDPEVQAPALAVRGNAKRALGRLLDAEEDLEEARRLLDSPGVTDPATPAELFSYLGSLRKDQGRFEEAAHHLDRAAALYGLRRDREKAAQAFLRLGTLHYRRHEPAAAVEADHRALELLDADAGGWLRAYAHYNLAFHFHAGGETDRAEAELAAHEELFAEAGEEVTQHVVWLRGRIAWTRGDLSGAERLYAEARERALERGIAWDAGLVSLELALVHLVQGRTSRVGELAAEALRVFAAQEVSRETRAALEILEAAARRDALTRELLEQSIAAVEGARHDRRAPAPSRP